MSSWFKPSTCLNNNALAKYVLLPPRVANQMSLDSEPNSTTTVRSQQASIGLFSPYVMDKIAKLSTSACQLSVTVSALQGVTLAQPVSGNFRWLIKEWTSLPSINILLRRSQTRQRLHLTSSGFLLRHTSKTSHLCLPEHSDLSKNNLLTHQSFVSLYGSNFNFAGNTSAHSYVSEARTSSASGMVLEVNRHGCRLYFSSAALQN